MITAILTVASGHRLLVTMEAGHELTITVAVTYEVCMVIVSGSDLSTVLVAVDVVVMVRVGDVCDMLVPAEVVNRD